VQKKCQNLGRDCPKNFGPRISKQSKKNKKGEKSEKSPRKKKGIRLTHEQSELAEHNRS